MRYYLWPHACEKRLRHYLNKGKVDLSKGTKNRKNMDAGDVAYFCIGRGRGIVACATLAGKPKPMRPNEVQDARFNLAVELKNILYIDPPIKWKCPRSVWVLSTRTVNEINKIRGKRVG